MATFDDFQKLDIRVGRVIEIEEFPEAKKPSSKKPFCFTTSQKSKIFDDLENFYFR